MPQTENEIEAVLGRKCSMRCHAFGMFVLSVSRIRICLVRDTGASISCVTHMRNSSFHPTTHSTLTGYAGEFDTTRGKTCRGVDCARPYPLTWKQLL